MKRLLFVAIIFVLLLFAAFEFLKIVKAHVRRDLAIVPVYPTSTASPTEMLITAQTSSKITSLLVPYWTIQKHNTFGKYQYYMYFGITVGDTGINQEEAGATHITDFISSVPENSNTVVVVRMLDSDNDLAVLKDPAKQNLVISQAITIAKAHQFKGIVLDLELQALPFDSIMNQVNLFTSVFYSQAKQNNLTFAMTIYGDTFFRVRPFDIKTLSHNADQLLVMSYDFSKSRGNPGPNFPLLGKDTYGYDLTKMADDFLQFVPPEKLSVVFGMFGYDWQVDDKGNVVGEATPLTDQQIQEKFQIANFQFSISNEGKNGENCKSENSVLQQCSIRRDSVSSEKEIQYVASDGTKHIVWFEDTDSAAKKQKYLQLRGINHFGYWAYSYF